MLQTNKLYVPVEQTTTESISSSAKEIVTHRQNRRSKQVYSTYTPNKRFSRYKNSLRTLLPFRLISNDELGVQHAGLFSFITFHWILKYFWKNVKSVSDDFIPLCPKSDSCSINSSRLNGILDAQVIKQGQNNLSVFIVVWNFMKTRIIIACILYTIGTLISIFGLVYFLPEILYYNVVEISNESLKYGLLYIFGLVLTELVSILLKSSSNAINLRTAMRLRSACFSALYRQAMIITLTYQITSWQLASFLLSDGQHIQELVMTFPNLICTPLTILFCMLFAGVQLDLWGYLSVLVVVIFFAIFICIVLFLKNFIYKATFFSDERVKLLEEFITYNLHVKLCKEEDNFFENISEKRENEVKNRKIIGLYDNICFSIIFLQPFLSLAALFVSYGNNVSQQNLAKFAAVSIILLIHVKQSLDNFWYGLNIFMKGLAALNKLKRITTCETINFSYKKPKQSNVAVEIEDANFQWTKQATLNTSNLKENISFTPEKGYVCFGNKLPVYDILCNINMTVEQSKLIGICGLPGSGKSSLLLAIMGLLLQSKGKRRTISCYSYVTQDPIIFQDTLKNNILFGRELDTQRYYRVTMHCELHNFISLLPEQDDTIIESKYLTLEQRQRIGLARALYEDGSIYLLDEPLSAIDYRKSAKIFDNCIIKSLNDKTVFIVTDNVEFLKQCDEIYMLEDGKILLQGQHANLLQNNPNYNDFIKYLLKQKNTCRDTYQFLDFTKEIPSDKLIKINTTDNTTDSSESLIIQNEVNPNNQKKVNDVEESLFHIYFSNFGIFWIILLPILQIINVIFISYLPVYFIYSLENYTNYVYLSFYFILIGWILIFGTFINYIFNKKMFFTSIKIHKKFLKKLFTATLSFFQTKYLSIISIVSIQLQLTDIEIPRLINNVFLNSFIVIMTLWVVFFTYPWYLCPTILIILIMIGITFFVKKSLLTFTQFDLEYNDTLYKEVTTMLKARSIIQAYDKINYFSKSLFESYDKYIVYLYIINAGKGWLNFVLECLSVLLLACIAFLSVFVTPTCNVGDLSLFSNNFNNTEENNAEINVEVMSLSCTSLAFVCTLQICYVIQKSLMYYLDISIAFDILSKVQQFKRNITKEEVNDKPKILVLENTAYRIKFSNVSLLSTTISVNEMSFTLKENDKIGFLGLTSPERKAIISLLYKFTEATCGGILIGKYNINEISIKNIRSLITIIPSEPYLFNKSIKNILMNDKFSSSNIIEVLKRFLLIEKIHLLPTKTDAIADQMLNTEEKQLLCLAKAYLNSSPIIIIEDFVNGSSLEHLICTQIKQLFPASTVLIFANEFTSLKDCDNITIFKNGKVIYSSNAANVISYYSRLQLEPV